MIDEKDIQEAINEIVYIEQVGTFSGNTLPALETLAAAYREKCEERDRVCKIAQELYNALYYGEGKLEAFDLWEDYTNADAMIKERGGER